jgi:hypothetical protein
MDVTGQADTTLRAHSPEEQSPATEQLVDDRLEISTASTSAVSQANSGVEAPEVSRDPVGGEAEVEPPPGADPPMDPADSAIVAPDTDAADAEAPAAPDGCGPPEPEAGPGTGTEPEPAGGPKPAGGAEPAGGAAEAVVALPAPQSASVPESVSAPDADSRSDANRDVRRAIQRLRSQIAGLPLALDLPKVVIARRERELLRAQLDDYLLPRLSRMDAPLLAVIGGSTGAGKSTLTNSLVRKEVSRSGVLRPTTRSPVLVHHPYDSGAFLAQRVLPDLARITSEALEPLQPIELDAPRITALRLVPHEGLTPGLALLDAPDIDSVVEANRDMAVQLLGAADLWLFVTTAARYGDAMPWQMLRTAIERGVAVAVVLDRVPPESLQEVRGQLARMMRDRGLGSSPMFVIPELPLHDGLLPWNVVAPLHRWLMRLGKTPAAREVVVRRTLAGIVDSLPQRSRLLVAAAAEQEIAAHVLGTELDAVFATARSTLTRRLVNGTVLRGEVLARWRELVGTGELVRQLERASGRLTDRMLAAVRKPSPLPTEPLGRALTAAVSAIIDGGVRETVDQALARWQALPGGSGLVTQASSAATDRAGSGPGTATVAAELVRQWQAGVLDAVASMPTQPRVTGRTLMLRPESIVVLVTLVCFTAGDATTDAATATGQLAAAEVVEGASLVRRLLDAVYGEPAIRLRVGAAREDLRSRVEDVLNAERAELKTLLDDAKVRPGVADALLAAVKVVENAR